MTLFPTAPPFKLSRSAKRVRAERNIQDILDAAGKPTELRRTLTLMSKDLRAKSPEDLTRRFFEAIEHSPHSRAEKEFLQAELMENLEAHLVEQRARELLLQSRDSLRAQPVEPAPLISDNGS